MEIDYGSLSDEELDGLVEAGQAEQQRRATLGAAQAQLDFLVREYQTASGRSDGEKWVQPTSALDAYLEGATVTHAGKRWVSLTPANVWEPGVSGWREVADPETGEPAVPDWVRPTGAHDAYAKGDRVTFEGRVYECLSDGNAYSPTEWPGGWKEITE